MKRRVVVTGIGALTPIGNNPQELWESVKAGKCGIDFIKNFDTSNHKVKIAAEIKNFNMDDYIEKRDAKKMDTYCQYAIVSAKQAFADSGLDIDALRIVAEGVNKLKTPETSTIVITHYQRLLDYIKPDIVHVLYKGRIVKTAGPELALELEEKGYDWIKKEVGE